MKLLTEEMIKELNGGWFWHAIGKAVGNAWMSYLDNWGYSDASHYTRKI